MFNKAILSYATASKLVIHSLICSLLVIVHISAEANELLLRFSQLTPGTMIMHKNADFKTASVNPGDYPFFDTWKKHCFRLKLVGNKHQFEVVFIFSVYTFHCYLSDTYYFSGL